MLFNTLYFVNLPEAISACIEQALSSNPALATLNFQ